MSPAVNAAVGPVARRQICLESLGPCHLHHWSHWALRELWGGPGGTPTGWVARETPKDTGKGRGLAGDGCGAGSTHWWLLQRRRLRQRERGASHTPKFQKKKKKQTTDRTLSSQWRQRSPSPQDYLGFDWESREESEQPEDKRDVCRFDQGGQIFILSSVTDSLSALTSSCFCYLHLPIAPTLAISICSSNI